MPDHDNILLILNDDFASWALGCYGNHDIATPSIDHLATTGVLMQNAFTPTPVCSPARASLLTGRLASQHGVHDYLSSTRPEIHDRDWLGDEITLPQLLSRAGYQTALIGKWHLGRDEQPQPGYDHWFGLTGDYPTEHGGANRYSQDGSIVSLSGYKTQILTDHAVQFLRKRDQQRPFYMQIGYVGTHNPWQGHPERLASRFRDHSLHRRFEETAYPFGRQNLESTLPMRLDPEESLAQYYASVAHIDEMMGRLLDELEMLHLRENTLIVFTSDHGLCCGQHGMWGKGNATLPLNMVEEAIHVPMIFNQPGRLFSHQRRAEFVDHLDLFQTLVEFAGIASELPTERRYPGRSFLPHLVNGMIQGGWRHEQFGEYGNLRMIRTSTHKLVRRYQEGPCELFDLRADPRETVNRFDDPDCQPLIDSLTTRLEAHFGHYEDQHKSGLRVLDLPQHNLTEAWRARS